MFLAIVVRSYQRVAAIDRERARLISQLARAEFRKQLGRAKSVMARLYAGGPEALFDSGAARLRRLSSAEGRRRSSLNPLAAVRASVAARRGSFGERRGSRTGVLPSFGMRKNSLRGRAAGEGGWISAAVSKEEALRLARNSRAALEDEDNPLAEADRKLNFKPHTPRSHAIADTQQLISQLKRIYLRASDAHERDMASFGRVRATVDTLRSENEAIATALLQRGVQLPPPPPRSRSASPEPLREGREADADGLSPSPGASLRRRLPPGSRS